MTPDHEAATKWAEEMLRLNSVSPLGKIGNAAACYLDAMARLAKATELLRALKARLDRYESVTGDDYAEVRAFLAAERK